MNFNISFIRVTPQRFRIFRRTRLPPGGQIKTCADLAKNGHHVFQKIINELYYAL